MTAQELRFIVWGVPENAPESQFIAHVNGILKAEKVVKINKLMYYIKILASEETQQALTTLCNTPFNNCTLKVEKYEPQAAPNSLFEEYQPPPAFKWAPRMFADRNNPFPFVHPTLEAAYQANSSRVSPPVPLSFFPARNC